MTPHFVTRQQYVLLKSESGLAPLTGKPSTWPSSCTSLHSTSVVFHSSSHSSTLSGVLLPAPSCSFCFILWESLLFFLKIESFLEIATGWHTWPFLTFQVLSLTVSILPSFCHLSCRKRPTQTYLNSCEMTLFLSFILIKCLIDILIFSVRFRPM